MKKTILLIGMVILMSNLAADTAYGFERDVFETPEKNIKITFLGHGTLLIEFGDIKIHVDPYSRVADYTLLPAADIILITHGHQDHYDMNAIKKIMKPGTVMVMNETVGKNFSSAIVMKNGESVTVHNIPVKAVPAYNTTKEHLMFHPRGRDNGYVITLGGKNIYIAGDTESIREMSLLEDIDIAFLPVNQPYTMTPEQAVEAALLFKPAILYPYHYGETDLSSIAEMLKGEPVEVRIRQLQ